MNARDGLCKNSAYEHEATRHPVFAINRPPGAPSETGRTVAARARRGAAGGALAGSFGLCAGEHRNAAWSFAAGPGPVGEHAGRTFARAPRAAPEARDAAVPLETGTAAGLIAGLDDGGADASRASISKAVEALADSPSSAALQAEVDRALAVDPVEFRYLKFQLRNKSRRLLQGLGKRLAGEAGQFSVEVRVHANSWGSAQRNLEVSARRAAVVREVLLAAGLPQERVRAEGVGGEPRRGRNDEETRRLNRRTEIRIVRN